MSAIKVSRREVDARGRAFRAALALEGLRMREFAAGLGCTRTHVLLVLKRERESERVDRAIDALIAKHRLAA